MDNLSDAEVANFMQKPLLERVKICSDMTTHSMNMLKKEIKDRNPGISEDQLKFEVVKSLYSDCYSDEEMNRIKEHFYSLANQARNI